MCSAMYGVILSIWAMPILAGTACPTDLVENSCIVGTAYSRHTVKSAKQCCSDCAADSQCLAWNLMAGSGVDLKCALKSVIGKRTNGTICKASGKYLGPKPPSPPPPSPPSPPSHLGLCFATLFQGGAVLQRDGPVSVWGTGAIGSVTLALNDKKVATGKVAPNGKWSVQLPAHAAAFNLKLSVTDATNTTSVFVSFGDVLLCSGQSNMGMPVDGKPGAFQADNGTAEAAAADRYTGGIWLWNQPQSRFNVPKAWTATSSTFMAKRSFSAVCWYTGKSHFERLAGAVPVGLIEAAVGGSPIEFWLSTESIAKCEVDEPRCDTQWPDSVFHDDQIVALQPYTIGAIIWDQAERDLKCNHLSQYPCLQRELARSWRREFNSPDAAFVVVQLPDYYDPKDPGAYGYDQSFGKFNFSHTSEGLLAMRLAQEAGLEGLEKAALVATYDQSCNNLAYPEQCPHGSVHNIHKQLIGPRVAAQLASLMHGEHLVVEGPRAKTASTAVAAGGAFAVRVQFTGEAAPFALQPTRNCTACCDGSALGDFDASIDGLTWASGSHAAMHGDNSVEFQVKLAGAPGFVRYTGGSNFTQCALFNAVGLPALPFQIKVATGLTESVEHLII